ncbi:MAG: oxygen-independent coproporphyrinogen III oxidase [Deltaproteobacteria bacterium]|nr:oxygen-independent coproporphyrinogen III oxidase [Deltaproteobacteria bacterium]
MTDSDPRDLDAWLRSADPRRIPAGLIEKYAVRGPRYTSYPTAPHFGAVDLDELYGRWRERNALAEDPGLSLYLHIPFCRTLCRFCGCHTHIRRDPARATPYVHDLLAEMDFVGSIVERARPVRQVALGGGTPNFLLPADLERLLGGIEERWRIARDAELSAELDPRTVTREQLDIFLAHGFNRLSLGVQDFDPRVLEAVRRTQDGLQVEAVVDHLRSRGCMEINFDLIYGLPRQDEDTAASMAAKTLELGPTRIALYNYAHVPWLKPHQKKLEPLGLPDAALKAAIQGTVAEALIKGGYLPIGMDHFARPDDRLARAFFEGTLHRNFMGYTTGRGLDQLAFGASGISGVGSTYAQDDRTLEGWRDAVRSSRSALVRGFLLDPEDEMRRDLILDLFCNFAVDLSALSSRWGLDCPGLVEADLERLEPMIRDGLVREGDGRVEVTLEGRPFIRNVCMTFDRYLEQDPAERRYSRTL